MQDITGLPTERWDFDGFYSEKPDYDLFACKVLVAGAIAVYLDLVSKATRDEPGSESGDKDPIERVINIFNALHEEASGPDYKDLEDCDPTAHDSLSEEIPDIGAVKKQYQERAGRFYQSFFKEYGERDCVGLLGFDPFNYFDYDEETQAQIESGEWMEDCCGYMKAALRLLYPD